MSQLRFTHFRRALTICVALLFVTGLFAAPAASAATAAAVDEYLPNAPGPPGGGKGPASGGHHAQQAGGQSAFDPGAGTSGATAVAGKQGALPFTGYPLTTLVLIVLALIATGLTIRLGVAAYSRLRPPVTGSPSG
jgi:hypothetical protein